MPSPPYQFDLGKLHGFVLYDFSQAHSREEFIVNFAADELELIALEFDFKLNEIPVGYNNLLLKAGDQYVLVDAGIRRPMGKLHSGLALLKIDSGDIGTIIITHSDRDHIGGILDQDGEVSFPNARYIMLEGAWHYWSSEEGRNELSRLNNWTKDKTQFAWETYANIIDSMLIVKSGEEFMPGFRLYPAVGHRYDHCILKVTSADGQLMHIADALAHPLFMANRDWYSTYDADPTQAIKSKIELLNMCAVEKALVFAAHFPFPGLGYVFQEQERWKWKPINAPDRG